MSVASVCPSRFTMANVVGAVVMMVFLAIGLTMSEEHFLGGLQFLQPYGVSLAIGECFVSMLATWCMVRQLLSDRRRGVWVAGIIFFVVALGANVADYWTTISFSPDLALEANPVWNESIARYGLEFGLWTGFLAKLGLSVLAGLCFMYYLSTAHRLAPSTVSSFTQFVSRIGECAESRRARLLMLFTIMSFYFASMNLFCFYVAYANSLVHNWRALAMLPPLPAVIVLFLIAITGAFFATTYRISKRSSED
jgi:hypothetical protein